MQYLRPQCALGVVCVARNGFVWAGNHVLLILGSHGDSREQVDSDVVYLLGVWGLRKLEMAIKIAARPGVLRGAWEGGGRPHREGHRVRCRAWGRPRGAGDGGRRRIN